jgi:hypothetical protein
MLSLDAGFGSPDRFPTEAILPSNADALLGGSSCHLLL